MTITVLTETFPTYIAKDFRRVFEREADIVRSASGRVYPHSELDQPYRRYEFDYGPVTNTESDVLVDFYLAVDGPMNAFLLEDPREYSSSGSTGTPASDDQLLGTGDGATTAYQARKAHTYGSTTAYRNITRLQSGTLLVEVNGVAQTEGVDFSVDYSTGIITFVVAPTSGHAVKAGFKFYIPVRFETDVLSILEEGRLVGSAEITLVEVVE